VLSFGSWLLIFSRSLAVLSSIYIRLSGDCVIYQNWSCEDNAVVAAAATRRFSIYVCARYNTIQI